MYDGYISGCRGSVLMCRQLKVPTVLMRLGKSTEMAAHCISLHRVMLSALSSLSNWDAEAHSHKKKAESL